jgi:hypothetical protein
LIIKDLPRRGVNTSGAAKTSASEGVGLQILTERLPNPLHRRRGTLYCIKFGAVGLR